MRVAKAYLKGKLSQLGKRTPALGYKTHHKSWKAAHRPHKPPRLYNPCPPWQVSHPLNTMLAATNPPQMANATTVAAGRHTLANRAFADKLREKDYVSALHVRVDLRAEDPNKRELQIWRTQTEPERKIGTGTLVSLWDSESGEPVKVLRRVTNIRAVEKYWVEFILEPYNPFPSSPDPNSHLTVYLAVPIKWAQLHHRTRVVYRVMKAAKHLQNTFTIAPDALPHIRQSVTRYWTMRE